MTPDIIHKCEMRADFCTEIFKEKFPSYEWKTPPIYYNLKSTMIAGTHRCQYNYIQQKYVNHEIKMNRFLLSDADQCDKVIHRTVAHEMCHYAQRVIGHRHTQAHGHLWKSLMVLVGLDPKRTHNYNMKEIQKDKRPYEYSCGCQSHFFTKRKHENVRNSMGYHCRKCKNGLKYIGLRQDVTKPLQTAYVKPLQTIMPSVKPLQTIMPSVKKIVANNRGTTSIDGREFNSKSAGALYLLKQRMNGENSYSKTDIAKIVNMTPQTVHAVQKKNNLIINFQK